MATVKCPNCGAIGNVGSVCEFCGTTIIASTEDIADNPRRKSKKISSEGNIKVYQSKYSSDYALKKAKEAVLAYLERIAKDRSMQEYWEYVTPIEEKAKLFSYKATLRYIPFYLFEFKAEVQEDKDSKYTQIKTLKYIGFAGSKSYPSQAQIDFCPIEDLTSFDHASKANAKSVSSSKFVKESTQVWDSIYGKKERTKFVRYEAPEVKRIFLPFYVVNISIRLPNENGDIVDEEIVMDYMGVIKDISNVDGIHNMLAEYYLGENCLNTLKKRKSERNKIEQEKKNKSNIDKQQRKQEEIARDTKKVLGCFAVLVIGIIIAIIIAFTSH